MSGPKVVSLFSGGGGLDLGFVKAGYDVIWAIDNNKDAVASYRRNLGDAIHLADITKISLNDIPEADVVIGGPPCQSFSLAGKRHVEDARGQLVWRYLEIIEHTHPKAFVFENVTGLLSAHNSKKERIIDLLRDEFLNIGYTLSMMVMNAADYGVPQKRKRVILVGMRDGRAFDFPQPTHGNRPDLKPFVTVEDAIGDLSEPTEDGKGVHYISGPDNEYQRIMRDSDTVTDHVMPTMSDLDRYIVAHVPPGGNYMDIPPEVDSERIRRLQREGGHTTCYGRMVPDEPSYTINTYFNRPNVGCNIHYSQDRLITVREAMRLQSFPDSYELVSSSKQGRCLVVGNAVPPLLAYTIAEALKKQL